MHNSMTMIEIKDALMYLSPTFDIPVKRLKTICSPFPFSVSSQKIEKAIEENRFSLLTDTDLLSMDDRKITTKLHVERVAYFVVNKCITPIWIDVGVKNFKCVILDGNHRLRAAIHRKDEFIRAHIFGEHVEYLLTYLSKKKQFFTQK